MDKIKAAQEKHRNNFNCAQAVFSTFCEELGLDEKMALKISTGFGGGMRCGEVCGAVTGALMALGLKYGHYISDDLESKSAAYKKTCDFIAKFKEKNNTIICKELLGYDVSVPEQMQKIKEQDLFNKVCMKMIADAVEITDEMLNENS